MMSTQKRDMLDILINKIELAVERKYCHITTNREIENRGEQAELIDRASYAGNAVASILNSKDVFIEYINKRNSSLTDHVKSIFDYLSKENSSEKDFKRARSNVQNIKKVIF